MHLFSQAIQTVSLTETWSHLSWDDLRVRAHQRHKVLEVSSDCYCMLCSVSVPQYTHFMLPERSFSDKLTVFCRRFHLLCLWSDSVVWLSLTNQACILNMTETALHSLSASLTASVFQCKWGSHIGSSQPSLLFLRWRFTISEQIKLRSVLLSC